MYDELTRKYIPELIPANTIFQPIQRRFRLWYLAFHDFVANWYDEYYSDPNLWGQNQ
jgi:hypothetical protein